MTTDKIDIHNYKGKLQRELKRLVTDQSLRKDHRQVFLGGRKTQPRSGPESRDRTASFLGSEPTADWATASP